MWKKALKMINTTIEIFTATCMGTMVLLVFIQIVSRAFIGSSFSWTSELSRYLMIWITFLGTSFAFRYGAHISVDFFIRKLPKMLANVITVIMAVISVGFFIILFKEGITYVNSSWVQTASALDIPMAYVYLVIPISCVLVIINLIDFTIKSLTGQKAEKI